MGSRVLRAALWLVFGLHLSAQVTVEWDQKEGVIRARGYSLPEPAEGWKSVLKLYAGGTSRPPMTGTYEWRDGELIFKPRYPIAFGYNYTVMYCDLDCSQGGRMSLLGSPFGVGDGVMAIAGFQPGLNVVPANLLRFYVTFQQPMSRGRVLQHLKLFRQDGSEVPMPFLDQELWDREQKRLTVFIDPGRVKRGVAPQQEMGAVLESGRTYMLTLEKGAEQADGQVLPQVRQTWRVGEPIREGIDPGKWRLDFSNTHVALDFGRELDWAILQDGLDVLDASGTVIEGRVLFENGTSRWVFNPKEPFWPGRYQVSIDPAMEDVAGNRLGRAFETEIGARAVSLSTTLWFEVEQ